MYDVSSGQTERIYDVGWDVQWPRWNGNIFIYDPVTENVLDTRVYRFAPETGDLFPTLHQGINFSSNGEYYFVNGYEGAALRVFRTEKETNLDVNLSIESGDRTFIVGYARGWLDEDTLIVPSPHPDEDGDYLYDIETGTLRYSTGAVLPTIDADMQGLVIDGTSFTQLVVNELEVVRE